MVRPVISNGGHIRPFILNGRLPRRFSYSICEKINSKHTFEATSRPLSAPWRFLPAILWTGEQRGRVSEAIS